MGSIPRTKRRPVSRRQRVKKYSFPVTTWVDGDLRRGVNVALSADGESRSKSLKARPEPRLPARVDTTAKVGEIFFRVCFYSGPAYKTRPRKSKKIFFGVGGHDQRGRCRRLLAPLPQRRAFVVLTVYEVRDLQRRCRTAPRLDAWLRTASTLPTKLPGITSCGWHAWPARSSSRRGAKRADNELAAAAHRSRASARLLIAPPRVQARMRCDLGVGWKPDWRLRLITDPEGRNQLFDPAGVN